MYLLLGANKERTQSNGEVPKIQLGKVTVAAHLTQYLFQEGLPLQSRETSFLVFTWPNY